LLQNPRLVSLDSISSADLLTLTDYLYTGPGIVAVLPWEQPLRELSLLAQESGPGNLFLESLERLVVQRLLPRQCTRCREKYNPGHSLREQLVKRGVNRDLEVFHAPGCEACQHRGIVGKVAMQKSVVVTPLLREMLSAGRWKGHPESKRESSFALLSRGEISLPTYLRITASSST